MKWDKLSMAERARYIRMGVESGITSLDDIHSIYNKFDMGGGLDQILPPDAVPIDVKQAAGDEPDQYINTIATGQPNVNLDEIYTGGKRFAAMLSGVGSIAASYPGGGIGIPLSIPDTVIDSNEVYNDPTNVGNWLGIVSDASGFVPGIGLIDGVHDLIYGISNYDYYQPLGEWVKEGYKKIFSPPEDPITIHKLLPEVSVTTSREKKRRR